MNRLSIAAICFGFFLMVSNASAKVEYHLNKVDNPSEDELDAYSKISAAMDSAVFLYNKFTHLSKHIEVYYNAGVQTADASYNGTMRFGSNRSYMKVRTAMHEMGHIMGMGTTDEYRNMFVDKVFQGPKTQALVKELTGDPTAEIHGDSQHFWPLGLNYDSELTCEEDLFNSARIVESMYQEIFKVEFYMTARVRYLSDDKCMGLTSSNGIEMMDCEGGATVVKIWTMGESPATHRFEFGERVLDVPNESTAAGVILGTYSWNGGAHQKYVFETTPVNKLGAFYLQNNKSKLYLLPSGKNVVQDVRGKDVESGIWILDQIDASADTLIQDTSVTDTSIGDSGDVDTTLAIGNRNIEQAKGRILNLEAGRFDVKGRAVRHSRKQAKFLKLF